MLPEYVNGKETGLVMGGCMYALSDFYSAFNGRDAQAAASNWYQSDDVSMDNPLGGIRRGWKEIRAGYERIMNGPARVFVEFHDYTLHQEGKVFYVVGRERGYFERDGNRLELKIRTSRIFRHVDGAWKQVHHHGSIEDPVLLDAYQNAVNGA